MALETSAADPTVTLARRPGIAVFVLLVGAGLTGLAVAMMVLDPAGAWLWEVIHWDIAATSGVLAIAISLRNTSGLVRQVGIGSLVAMTFWMLSNLAWTVMALNGTIVFPSIVDVLALLWIVPGIWMLIVSIHGRLGRAEEIAVYLDAVMVFVATSAVLLTIFGPTAYFIGGPAGLLIALYPATFIGAAATSMVAVFATRQPLRVEGGVAIAIGTAVLGVAYATWVLPAVTGNATDPFWATLFSIGPLIAAYGAITWQGPSGVSASRERLSAIVGWTIGPVALLVTAISAVAITQSGDLGRLVFGLTVVSASLLIVRFALHLQERTGTLAEMRRLFAENEDLVARLRREAQERERVHARLVDASRMSAVGELAAAVAHEVNNPLTGVLGYADLLLADTSLSPGVREDLGVVRAEAIRVRDRIRVLLEFATPRRPDSVSSDLGAVVGAPLALLRYNLERRGLVIEERYATMAAVFLDPPAIQQVVINVVTEIAAAMPSGGRLTVSTETTSGGASVILDATGSAIDVDAIRTTQSPFDDDFGTEEEPGAIVSSYGILRGHGATIGLREATADHIRIEIHLPRAAATTG